MKTVGIIGYGTIGTQLNEWITRGDAGAVTLTKILVRNLEKYKGDPLFSKMTDDPELFFSLSLDIVIEAGGHEAVRQYAETTLLRGSDLVVVSVGAFCDELLLERVQAAAQNSNRRFIVPSCAIGGLDRIAAGSLGQMERIRLTTRKPPKAWKGTYAESQVNLDQLEGPVCIFEGTARDSARLFPESVNVSAALSLAGIGFDRTTVRVFVDPTITHNTHEIDASGFFGEIQLTIRNQPSPDNPKTGYIVAMSIAKVLRDLSTYQIIGI
jgi:aspartate dehydrogenase